MFPEDRKFSLSVEPKATSGRRLEVRLRDGVGPCTRANEQSSGRLPSAGRVPLSRVNAPRWSLLRRLRLRIIGDGRGFVRWMWHTCATIHWGGWSCGRTPRESVVYRGQPHVFVCEALVSDRTVRRERSSHSTRAYKFHPCDKFSDIKGTLCTS